jgi:hypothetical protein
MVPNRGNFGDKYQSPGPLIIEILAKSDEKLYVDSNLNLIHEYDIDPIMCIADPNFKYQHLNGNKLNFKFIIHYVVQKNNYKEMPLMVELSKKYLADHIWFNRITNWNTFKNYLSLKPKRTVATMSSYILIIKK